MLHLSADSWDIKIDPSHGCLFHHCRYQGSQVFRDSEPNEFPPYGAAHFPLLPFSNRIRDSRFTFLGQNIQLSQTAPNQAHCLHGYGWIDAWTIEEQSQSHCVFTHSKTASDWPWSYEAKHLVSVENSVLTLEINLKNTSQDPMPAGLGFHPYFPELDNAMIAFESNGVWLAGDDILPTTHIASPPGFDFSLPQKLSHYQLDHCFTGTNKAEISWDNSNRIVTVESSQNLNRAAVYTAHAQNSFCFEPISHTHNALNMPNPETEGIRILLPQETMTAWSRFTVSL